MKRVLVVDDEPAILDLVVAVLRDEGYAAEGVPDGRAALAVIEREPPDLVLMDVMMPRLDGRRALRALRERPGGADVPVVLMSAAADPASLHPPPTAFLAKPFDLDALLGLVDRILGPAT